MPEADRAGHRTFWQSYGTGTRPGLAIHCSLAHSGAWAGVAGRLADRVTLTAFDMPGHGRSGAWDGRGDYLAHTVAIAETFLPDDGPVDLIGHSFGAVAALKLALTRPEAVRTLSLVEPVLFAAARGTQAHEALLAAFAPFEAALAAGDAEAAARVFTGIWGTGASWDRTDPATRADLAARIGLIPAGSPALFGDSGHILVPGRLETLEMPVMILCGAESPPVIPAIAEAIAARLPDVGVATVPGARHMLPVTHPAEVAGLIGVNLDRG